MEKCLAHVDQNQHSSVAFPAMGTGNLGYPRETVAKEMFSIVHNFGSSNPSTTISDVYFVLYDRDTETVKVGTADDINGQIVSPDTFISLITFSVNEACG